MAVKWRHWDKMCLLIEFVSISQSSEVCKKWAECLKMMSDLLWSSVFKSLVTGINKGKRRDHGHWAGLLLGKWSFSNLLLTEIRVILKNCVTYWTRLFKWLKVLRPYFLHLTNKEFGISPPVLYSWKWRNGFNPYLKMKLEHGKEACHLAVITREWRQRTTFWVKL